MELFVFSLLALAFILMSALTTNSRLNWFAVGLQTTNLIYIAEDLL